MAEMNLWIDSYDDIFSDFDSRHYLKRRISEDFIHELQFEMKYVEQPAIDMILLLPEQKRSESAEKIIKASLVNFFTHQFHDHQDKCRKKFNTGIVLLVTGIVIMLLNSWLGYYPPKTFLVVGVKILLEPAGWFLIWVALDFLYYDHTGLKKERDLYKQLAEMHIHFGSS